MELVEFKCTPITTCDVERSFSTYKTILTENRRKFPSKNLFLFVPMPFTMK